MDAYPWRGGERYGVEARYRGVGEWRLMWGYGPLAQAVSHQGDYPYIETRIVPEPSNTEDGIHGQG